MKFIGRKKELQQIQSCIDSNYFQAALIYGRRRVGKSALIKQAIKKSKVKAIYYECKETNEKSNLKNLNNLFTEVLDVPPLNVGSVEELFEFIFKNYIHEKTIIVLDEYPFLRKCIEGCDSIFQSLIDNYKDDLDVTFFFCGSYVDTMKSLLERSNPLYGRFDCILDLKPMNYLESSEFYPHFSNEDKVRIYSVFGGIPYYNQFIDDSKTVKENIIHLIASENARLLNEVPDYLGKEIGKMANANEAVSAMSAGHVKFNDILSQSHVPTSPTLADVLNKLINMELIEKVAPINDENNKKKTGYYIKDNFANFYYRYIYRYNSQLMILDPKYFYDKYIKKDFEEQFVPKRFESLCKEYLIKENKQGHINPPFLKIGKYYYDLAKEHKNGEFDIVTEDDIGNIFYEVKFTSKPLKQETIHKEIEQVKHCGVDCYKYGFISKAGYEDKRLDNVIYLTLDDVYKK